jgi:hypothetical protein
MAERAALSMALAQPGPEHERLAGLAGKFNVEVKLWMSPGAEPMLVAGSGENRTILGGRFLEMAAVTGEGAMETHGLILLGFDRRHEKYTLINMDNWGTYYITAAGTFDKASGKIVMSGEDEDPVMEHTQVFDWTLQIIDDDTYVFEVIFKDEMHTRGGPDFKMLEFTGRREK